ncbi:MAG TPA: CoA transferase, partial [Aldersonia sp.]
GQVIDSAMVDGTLALSHMIWGFRGQGLWTDDRAANLLDTGKAFYDTYETADGKFFAVGAIEPQFYAELLRILELDPADLPAQLDPAGQETLRKIFADRFRTRTRDEWAQLFVGTDACASPVLTFGEAGGNAHLAARGSLIEVDGVQQHAPAPRFSRTPAGTPTAPPRTAIDAATIWR